MWPLLVLLVAVAQRPTHAQVGATPGRAYLPIVPRDQQLGWQLQWTSGAGLPDSRGNLRTGLGAALGGDGRLYVVGGDCVAPSGDRRATLAYDAGAWSTRALLPTDLVSLAVAAGPNGRLYAFGGTTVGEGADPVGATWDYDPAAASWSARAPMPTARAGAAAVLAADGRIYVIGGLGRSGAALTVVEAYDALTDRWTTRQSMPSARFSLAVAASSDGRVYAVGGRGALSSSWYPALEVYDPAADAWTVGAPMPTGRHSPGAAFGPNGVLYVVGGLAETGPSAAVEGYDPGTGRWAAAAPLSEARAGPAVVADERGAIHAVGGCSPGGIAAGQTFFAPSGAHDVATFLRVTMTPAPTRIANPTPGPTRSATPG